MVIVRNGSQVIGGITYRTFPGTPAARLGEIAFCAVAQTLQVAGYGTRLMNWTKVSRGREGASSSLHEPNECVALFQRSLLTLAHTRTPSFALTLLLAACPPPPPPPPFARPPTCSTMRVRWTASSTF